MRDMLLRNEPARSSAKGVLRNRSTPRRYPPEMRRHFLAVFKDLDIAPEIEQTPASGGLSRCRRTRHVNHLKRHSPLPERRSANRQSAPESGDGSIGSATSIISKALHTCEANIGLNLVLADFISCAPIVAGRAFASIPRDGCVPGPRP